MLVLLLIVVLIILSLMFGGFQKGTKSSGLGPQAPVCTGCTSATELSAYSLWMPRSCSSEEAGYWRVGRCARVQG